MIVDCHTHVFPDAVVDRAVETLRAAYRAEPVARPSVAGLLAHMRESGVDRSVLCPVATRPVQVPSINEWLLSLKDERLIPFGALHPHYEDNAGEIERLLAAGVRGVKLQPFFQGFTLREEATERLLDQIGDRLLVLMHAGDEIFPLEEIEPTPERLARLLDRFPRLRMIAAHAGAYRQWEAVEEHLVGRDLLFDLSYTFGFATDEQVRRIIASHGYQQILWGSDFPWQSQSFGLEALRGLGLPPEQEAAILAGNLRREMAVSA